jgi:large repetitive protein
LPVASNLTAAVYLVIIKNSNNCISGVTSAIITPAPSSPAQPLLSIVQPTCTAPAGSITVTNTQNDFTYSFDNGLNFQSSPASGLLTPGSYMVVIKNAVGCVSTVATAVLNAATVPSPATFVVSQPSCIEALGSITITNGLPGDQFSFNNGLIYQTAATASGMVASTYTLIIKNSGGCTSAPVIAVVNPGPTQAPTPLFVVSQPTCANNTGNIVISNGSVFYFYSFDNGVNYQSSNSSGPLPSGTYQLRIRTDVCESEAVPAIINAAPAAPPAPMLSITQPTCATNTGVINVTNTAAGFTYSADGGTNYQPASVFGALVSGSYIVHIKNFEGCVSASTVGTINPPPVVPTAPVFTITQPTCANATGNITITNATVGMEYSFDDGVSFGSSSLAGGLLSGTYLLRVRINGGCVSPAATAIVTSVPLPPAAPVVSASIQYCKDATATALTATGAALQWYSMPTGGLPLSAAPVPATAVVGSTDFFVSQTVAGCESDRAKITVSVSPKPLLPAVISPVAYCEREPAAPLSASGIGLLWYTTSTGGAGTVLPPAVSTALAANLQYYVTQTVGGCESDRAMIAVQVKAAPNLGVPVTEVICIGQRKNYLADFAAIGIVEVLDESGVPVARPDSVTADGVYQIVAAQNGCSDTVSRTLSAVPPPVIFAGNDTLATTGKPLQLNVVGAPASANYSWTALPPANNALFSNPAIANPTVTLTLPNYLLVAKVDVGNGCTATDTIRVKVLAGPAFYVPNAFSPNADGLNDLFRPFAPGINLKVFRVYNRYGQLIYESNNAALGWDGTYKGKLQPTGNYVWYVQGTLANGASIMQKGNVLLVR